MASQLLINTVEISVKLISLSNDLITSPPQQSLYVYRIKITDISESGPSQLDVYSRIRLLHA